MSYVVPITILVNLAQKISPSGGIGSYSYTPNKDDLPTFWDIIKIGWPFFILVILGVCSLIFGWYK